MLRKSRRPSCDGEEFGTGRKRDKLDSRRRPMSPAGTRWHFIPVSERGIGATAMALRIPFNRPFTIGTELAYVAQAIEAGHLSGDGGFTARCSRRLEEMHGASRALLTHSGTSALEMAALLTNVGPGDEVILPSYTFVSTANAFVLRGATPVFVDIRPDTLNIDETLVEAAITAHTRAIVAVHYAGVASEMDALADIARAHGLLLIEDAAQGVLAAYRGRPLG